MSWSGDQRLGRYVRTSVWLVPAAAMMMALMVAPLIRWLDDRTRWTLLGFGIEGARNVMLSLGSSLLTFIVFTFSTLLLVMQMASSQLTPRIIARAFEDRHIKFTVGVFVFSWVYSLAAIGRVEERVPQLAVALSLASAALCIPLFLHLVQRVGSGLRPVAVMTAIARETRDVIDRVYPGLLIPGVAGRADCGFPSGRPATTVVHDGYPGVLLALDLRRLEALAVRGGCTIEVVPTVGDFVATGEDLFRVHGAAAPDDVRRLHECIALGPERALDRDPLFGFRILVDIASRALSPAVNDPTTATLAVDQLHYLLHRLAERELDPGLANDGSGVVRVIYRSPRWEDFVMLAVSEIRLYGAQSPQVTRRLQAMLDGLIRVVPPSRRPALEDAIRQLRLTVERAYADPLDRDMALRSDTQGFGSELPGRGPIPD